MRAFPIQMPSGDRYWTVVNDRYDVHQVADQHLRELRFGRDRAESTSKAYAEGISLFLRWCAATGRDWRSAAGDLGLFITWLKYQPAAGARLIPGPGAKPVRSVGRINRVLVAVRGFLAYAVVAREVPTAVMDQLYEMGDTRDLPVQARGEDSCLRYRLRARHRMSEPKTAVDRATDDEIVAMIQACRSARDRLVVLLLSRVGLRRGEAAGLRRSDVHFLPDNRVHGCAIAGAHLHVVRRPNANGAWAKSRHPRAVPVDFMVVRSLDLYLLEREEQPAAAGCDYLLVNLFRAPLGAPMQPGAFNELFESLSRRAGLTRTVTPHQGRHAFGSNLADSGALLDEIQMLMGHASATSAQPYLHPSADRLRAAVEQVGSPRATVDPT